MSNLTTIVLSSSGQVTSSGQFSTLDAIFGVAGTANVNVASIQGISGAVAVPVSFSGTTNVAVVSVVTTPVTVGTVTVTGSNIGITGAATVTVASITGTSNVSVVSTVTTPITVGTITVTGSGVGVTGTFFQTTQSVTGTVTVNTVTSVSLSGTSNIVSVSSAIPGTTLVSVVNATITTQLAPSNFLWYSGYSANNGLVGTTITVITGEIQSLTASGVTISATGGASGVFNSSGTGTNQAIWGDVYYSNGAPGVTTTGVGVNIAGWWIQSFDGGTTFESASTSGTVSPPRPPDWIIPLPTTVSTTVYKSSGLVRMPSTPFKVLVQNNYAATLGTGATTAPYIKISQIAVQH